MSRAIIRIVVNANIISSFIRNACAQKLGFSNAELLQDTDWKSVQMNPKKAQPKMPKWVFAHDPEVYAYENWEKNLEAMKAGIPHDESDVPPNYPPGYKYEPWSIDDIMDKMQRGEQVELGSGNWD